MPATAQTKVITVRSNEKTELRVIPFQNNDFTSLKNTFPEATIDCDAFDDSINFKSIFQGKVNEFEFSEIDTMIVVCSAIGDVDKDFKPILRATDGTKEISIEDFLDECSKSQAANRIVILDCGHDFSKPESYFSVNFHAGDDFNKFTEAVGSLLSGIKTSDGRPIWVITSTSPGEIPLYSVNQRRTLFSRAIENALAENSYDNVGQFYDALQKYCHEHGGEAAQTPLLFESGAGRSKRMKWSPVSAWSSCHR